MFAEGGVGGAGGVLGVDGELEFAAATADLGALVFQAGARTAGVALGQGLIGLDAGVGVEPRFEQIDGGLVEAGERVLWGDGIIGVVLGPDESVNAGAGLLDL